MKQRRALIWQLHDADLWDNGGEIIWGWASNITAMSPRLRGVVDVQDNFSTGANFKDAWLAKK